MFTIVALGNPGSEYIRTRHNAAWLVLDELFPDVSWQSDRYAQALLAKAELSHSVITLIKPQTFMNRSGETVGYLVGKGLLSENLIVIQDDVDLPLGKIRISFDSSAGGHNGIKSITNTLGTAAYTRVRIGIAPVDAEGNIYKPADTSSFVLKDFSSPDLDKVQSLAPTIKHALETIVEEGKEVAMNRFN
jgi:PTH1 family peptidyl-tRNA hydrolase